VSEPEHEPTVEELVELMRSTYHRDDDGSFRLLVRTAAEIMEIPDPPPEWSLLGPLVYRGYRTIVVGDTGHGKTTFALQALTAIVSGAEMLGWTGAGVGPVLVVDLEQGLRSIKRGIREAGVDGRDDVLYITVPDGLALDQDPEHFAALDAAIFEHQPVAVLLDPYYKAHRAEDPNSERAIIDLMRALDAFRTRYHFALLLPAHPRKEIAGKEGLRKLTLHDVSGSGAMTRGAEIVLGIERGRQGFARLRYLKDRDGDLEVNAAMPMLYTRERGFHLDTTTTKSDDEIEAAILARPCNWLTAKEWSKELSLNEGRVREALERLRIASKIGYEVGPPGRGGTAKCYTTNPDLWVSQLELDHLSSPGSPSENGGEPVFLAHPSSPSSPEAPDGGEPGDPPPERGEHLPSSPPAPAPAHPSPDHPPEIGYPFG
jgi:hypothetical protein